MGVGLDTAEVGQRSHLIPHTQTDAKASGLFGDHGVGRFHRRRRQRRSLFDHIRCFRGGGLPGVDERERAAEHQEEVIFHDVHRFLHS